MIAKSVWRKLRHDAELTRQMQAELKYESKLQSQKMAQGIDYDELDEKNKFDVKSENQARSRKRSSKRKLD